MWLHREAFARLLIDALIYRDRSDARLRAEVLALRYHLRVLERRTNRPRWQPTDRLLLAAISRFMPRPSWRSLLPSPETLLRWHRELVRRTMGRVSAANLSPPASSQV